MPKLNYCMLKSDRPNEAYVVYVALPNTIDLHPSVMDHPCFPEIKMILEYHGFEITSAMSFRIDKKNKLKVRALHADLMENDYERNKALEKNIKAHIDRIKQVIEVRNGPNTNVTANVTAGTQSITSIPIFALPHATGLLPAKMSSRVKRSKTGVVGVNEGLKLNVYLFLRATPTDDNSIEFEFEFDFFSKANNDFRRFIKIIECTFIRKDQGTSNIIYLESEKTLRDILKEMDFLYSIRLMNPNDVLNGVRSEPVVYNAIELKDFLILDGRISLHVDVHQSYDEILGLSERIGKERVRNDRNVKVPVSLIKRVSKSILERMEQRRVYYSDHEDYELAASYKRNHEYIASKVRVLEDFEQQGMEKLNSQDYERCFTMKDFDF